MYSVTRNFLLNQGIGVGGVLGRFFHGFQDTPLVNGRRGPLEGLLTSKRPPVGIRRSILYRLTTPFVNVCWLVS